MKKNEYRNTEPVCKVRFYDRIAEHNSTKIPLVVGMNLDFYSEVENKELKIDKKVRRR